MTSAPVDDLGVLRRIMDRADALFLDFDGPVCDLFAGIPASVVADQLCAVLADSGHDRLPPDIEKSNDPFDLLKYAATLGQAEAEHVNVAFTAHEVEAVATAAPTPGAHDLIRTWGDAGRPVAIVSNNSRTAVESYLELHQLRQQVSYVSARVSADPGLLKPSAFLLRAALSNLDAQPVDTVFVGDSITDLDAAREASVIAIGYANRPDKVGAFAYRSAAVTTDLARLISEP